MITDDLAWKWMFDDLSEEQITEIASFQMPWEDISYYTLAKDFLSSSDPYKEYEYEPKDLPPIITPDNPEAVQKGQMELF